MDEFLRFELPPKTAIFAPDGINRVCIMFPDQDSAVLFYEVLRQFVIESTGMQDAGEA